MSYILPIVLSGVIGASSGVIGSWIVLKQSTKISVLMEKIDELTMEIVNDEDILRRLYTIGGVLGKGVVDGTGLQNLTKHGGKLSLGGIIQQLVGGWLEGHVKGGDEDERPQNQNLIQNKRKVEW